MEGLASLEGWFVFLEFVRIRNPERLPRGPFIASVYNFWITMTTFFQFCSFGVLFPGGETVVPVSLIEPTDEIEWARAYEPGRDLSFVVGKNWENAETGVVFCLSLHPSILHLHRGCDSFGRVI